MKKLRVLTVASLVLLPLFLLACNQSEMNDSGLLGAKNTKPMDVKPIDNKTWAEVESEMREDLKQIAPAAVTAQPLSKSKPAGIESESVMDLEKYFVEEKGLFTEFSLDKFIQLYPDDPPLRIGNSNYYYRYPYLYYFTTNNTAVQLSVLDLAGANELMLEDVGPDWFSERRAASAEKTLQ